MIVGKRKIQSEMRKRKDTIPSYQGGKMTKSIEIAFGWTEETVETWIQLGLMTSHMPRHGVSAQDMRIIFTLGINDGAHPGRTKH